MKNVKKVKGLDPWAEPPHLKIVESIHLPPPPAPPRDATNKIETIFP